MNSLTVTTQQLPDTIEDLSKFVLVGREKLKAVKAEINAIQKVGLAKEVLEQKRAEAQEIAELVTLSEVRIGAMLKEIPKSSGARTDLEPIRSDADRLKTKKEVLTEIGIKQDTAERYQKMAEHEDIVREALAEARKQRRKGQEGYSEICGAGGIWERWRQKIKMPSWHLDLIG